MTNRPGHMARNKLCWEANFQNKGTLTSPARLSFVLEVPLRCLRPSIIYSVPCDRIGKGPIHVINPVDKIELSYILSTERIIGLVKIRFYTWLVQCSFIFRLTVKLNKHLFQTNGSICSSFDGYQTHSNKIMSWLNMKFTQLRQHSVEVTPCECYFLTLWPFLIYIVLSRFHAIPKSHHWFVVYNLINNLRISGWFSVFKKKNKMG